MGNVFDYAENELKKYSCSCPSVEETNKRNIESAIQAMRDYAKSKTDVSDVISIIGIIERLYIQKPLSPITDEDFTETCGWSEYRFQTSRFPMMIKKIDENTGEVVYSDLSRVSTVIDNWDNFGGSWNLSNGFTISLIDSMYPIELPYYPTTFTQYIVHEDRYAIETTEDDDYDTIHVKYAIDKKNDVYLPIDRYFTEIGIEDSNDFREITKEEFDKLMDKKEK